MITTVNLIIEENNKVLLVKRAENSSQGGKWSIPGGKLRVNETEEFGLRREILEELGCKIREMRYFCYNDSDYKEVHSVYFVGKIEGNISTNKEISAFNWFSREQIKELDIAFNQDKILDKFFETS